MPGSDAYWVFSNCVFLPFGVPCSFFLEPYLMCPVKGTVGLGPLVVWGYGGRGSKSAS